MANARETSQSGLSEDGSDPLAVVRAAFEQREAARRCGQRALGTQADHELRAAVDAARDAGTEWGKIAAVLGTRRGNAYERYRRPPRPTNGETRPAL